MVLHLFQPLRGMAHPDGDFAHDPKRLTRAVGLRRISRKFLVREIGSVGDWAGWLLGAESRQSQPGGDALQWRSRRWGMGRLAWIDRRRRPSGTAPNTARGNRRLGSILPARWTRARGAPNWPPEPDEKGDLERNIIAGIAGIAAHQAAPSPSAIAARSKDTRVDIKDFKQSNARPNTMP
jgi:hypothetical protein